MDIIESSLKYERWMAAHIKVVKPDLLKKHAAMAADPFIFLRGTFYRWCQVWPVTCDRLTDAPVVPSVGDLHIENFGTWRDNEGRLVWGVNDVDEACRMPYTNDLVRLATSATLAARHGRLDREARALCDAILEGYISAIERGGRAFVLAERRLWLRRLALNELRDPVIYWAKFDALPLAKGDVPRAILRRALPNANLAYRLVSRVAGVGSLGRRRIVALAMCEGARVAREAKSRLPSGLVWATGRSSLGVSSEKLIARAVRSRDPFLQFYRHWIVRRLAPDCSRIELSDLPRSRDEEKLLRAMGAETANMHVRHAQKAIRADLRKRKRRWLEEAAGAMADAVEKDWHRWARHAG